MGVSVQMHGYHTGEKEHYAQSMREVFQSWPHAPIMDIAGQVRPATNGKEE